MARHSGDDEHGHGPSIGKGAANGEGPDRPRSAPRVWVQPARGVNSPWGWTLKIIEEFAAASSGTPPIPNCTSHVNFRKEEPILARKNKQGKLNRIKDRYPLPSFLEVDLLIHFEQRKKIVGLFGRE